MKTIHVVAAAIFHKSRVLATQRGYGDFKDSWEFPGGKIEPHETPEMALAREIREELDLDIQVGDSIGRVHCDYPDFHLDMEVFACRIKDGKMVLKEHEGALWASDAMLDDLAFLPADLEVLPSIKKFLLDSSL